MSAPAKKARRGYKLTPCGEIPQDWECVTLGSIFAERIETGFTDLPLLAVTGERGIVLRDSLERRDSSSEDKSAYLRVCPGDIAYNTMRMWQGVSGLSPYEGIVSPAYTVCRPLKGLVPEFAPYLLKHPANIRLFHRHSQGLVDDTLNLKFPHFAQIYVSVPTLKEQKKVAELLKDADRAISLSENLTDQMSAVRDKAIQARIQVLGVRDHVMGEILVSIDAGKSPLCEDRPACGGEVGVLKVGAVSPAGFLPNENKVVRDESVFRPEMEVRLQDLLLTRANGSPELIGMSCIVDRLPGRLYLSDKTFRLRVDEKRIDKAFLNIALKSPPVRAQIEGTSTGGSGSMANLSQNAIRALKIPIPPLARQREIVELDRNLAGSIDAEERKLAALERVKGELARRLLTGELRIKS